MTGRARFAYCWLPAIGWAVAIIVGTSLPSIPGPDLSAHNKTVHVIIYLVLGLLLLRGFMQGEGWSIGRSAGWTILTGGTFGALQEFNQVFIPERTGSLADVLANLAGVSLAAAAVWVLTRREGEEDLDG